jgi:plastocyanin
MRRPRLLLLACCALLASCGGDDNDNKSSGSDAVTIKPGRTLNVDATEYAFHPKRVTVEDAGDVTFELDNRGHVPHNLTIRRGDAELPAVKTIKSGDVKEGTLSLATGNYEFFCSVGDHAKLGMRGTLIVK